MSDPETITTASFSRLMVYEKCPFEAKLKFIDKIPEPEELKSKAAERGTLVHFAAENFVQGKTPGLIAELMNFEPELYAARDLYEQGLAIIEEDWAFTKNWTITSWTGVETWLRMKLDICVRIDRTAWVIDHKTGRKFNNEVKHGEQGMLYALAVFLRYPEIEKCYVEFWYHDLDDISIVQYTRQQALRFQLRFDQRFRAMTSATRFPPRPSIHTCKWCPYKPTEFGGTGHCKHGVNPNLKPTKGKK